ncbi:MAG: tetratricopeptide repeat protein [Bacteroidales bacterium]|nr:tetratricopeptide repeat protein [Bacteroidales bacterium]
MKHLAIITILVFISQVAFSQQAEEFYEKAKTKEKQKDFQYASILIDKAIELNDTNIWYWLKKAEIQLNMEESYLTIDYIKRAISIDSTNSEPYNRAGSYYNSRGLKDSSIYMYNKAIRFAENDTIRYSYVMNRGTAKISVMDYKGALEDFKDVLNFKPNDIGCLNNIGNVYKKLGETEKAIQTLKKVIILDENLIGPYINLGLIYTEIDSLDNAIEYFDKALNISPDEPLLFSNRGFTYYKMGNYKLALKDINKSLKGYPTNSYAYKNLALVYFKMDLINEGCTALKYAEHYEYEKRYGDEVKSLIRQYCEN